MKLLKHLIHDIALWFLLAACFFQWNYHEMAENLISFYGIFLLLLGILCLFTTNHVAKQLAKDPDFKPRNALFKSYVWVTACIEICIVAAMGWYWVTAGFVLFSIAISNVRSTALKERNA